MTRRKPYEFKEPSKAVPSIWRSLEEKETDPATLREQAEAERPGGFLDVRSLTSRRSFLQVSAATAAAVSLEACVRRPVENIVPHVQGPEYLVPGVPLHFATVTSRGGDALGLLVVSHEGRPTKVEGNPEHPSSGGRSDVRAQGMIADLYDADRSQKPAKRQGDQLVDVAQTAFDDEFRALIGRHRERGGRGLRFLAEPTNSPTFLRLRDQLLREMPEARFHTWASVHDSSAVLGAELAFGRRLRQVVAYDKALAVVSIDSDFLGEDGSVRDQRAFAMLRRPESPESPMSRLYVVEPGHSVTGAAADHRLRVPASRGEAVLKALGRALAARGVDLGAIGGALGNGNVEGVPAAWLEAAAGDLVANRGASAIVVGKGQAPRVHALAAALNGALGNLGQTVLHFPVADASEGDVTADLKRLVDEIAQVETLVILGGNPVYDAPSDLQFERVMQRQGLTTVHLASHRDETSRLASWHCALAHELEAWGDQRAVDGTVAVQQPLIAPLYHARSAIELLGLAAGVRNWRGYNLVRATMRGLSASAALFERDFRRVLHRGIVDGTTVEPVSGLAPNAAGIQSALATPAEQGAVTAQSLEVSFRPDPKLHDGRHANNLWLLELPHTMTKLVWDNAALVSVKTRRELGLSNGDIVKLSREGAGSVEVPVFALPGHADNCITLNLGWGRTAPGRYGRECGFDVHPLRTTSAMGYATGVRLEKTGRTYQLVVTQEHDRMEGRPIALDGTLAEYRQEPDFASYRSVDPTVGPLWDEVDYEGRHRWGMVIDLSSCTGCNACTIACQAENNIPTVGKREVARGREMFWIRIDRYFLGDDADQPTVALQPIGCQHCEEAPCENVCPVNATAHSPEGLNDMAYNRCIGTRYCANNCPYKVRRFNYLDWHTVLEEFGRDTDDVHHVFTAPSEIRTFGEFPHVRRMQFNPNVTVRMRGVIEKCSYCVQRIQEAKIASRREHRPMRDGDVVPACAQACPSESITFGDLNDRESRVARLAARDRNYKLLAEVGTQPRTTFLAKIRNPNPALGNAAHGADAEEAHQ